MPDTYEKLLEDSIEIDAAPEAVWALVTDLPRMARWSPQVVRSKVWGGVVRSGAKFTNLNRRGYLFWPTNGKVVRYTPPSASAVGELGFRINENRTVWSFTLEPTATGTRVIQRRETPEGISGLSIGMTKAALGGQDVFTEELRAGMRQTLERIKADAEG
ncbi:SRPBCC family protein [Nocardioides sp. GY 10113]|uniref:SRPBCC family protein n=1 Tax=Nocardioides sp. GY 10113 TaxID=2569761 RepID=UPI0010A7A545|nr:SRPBCC family protein [Nocardioides sp. GY 10113]TIC89005.1 SRPBCC family protein [Nocardioides sp. GY 10113]